MPQLTRRMCRRAAHQRRHRPPMAERPARRSPVILTSRGCARNYLLHKGAL